MRISAVVPVLDEESTLGELHGRLTAVLRSTAAGADADFEVIFVDDGSTDGSPAVLRGLADEDPRVAVVELRRTFGKSAALAAGFAQASGDVIVTLDADLQDVPEEVPKLLARLREGADLAIGRKHDRRDPFTRRLASRAFNLAVSWLAGARGRDINSGLKAMRREVAREVPLHGELHRFLAVLARARGFRIEEVDVAHEPRRHGRSRYGWSRYAAGALDMATVLLLTRFGKRPLHFFGIVGGLLAFAGGSILAYLAVGWLFGHWIGNRPLLPFGVLLVILGIQSLFFGLLAELTIVSAFHRDPGYSVRAVRRRPEPEDARERGTEPAAAAAAAAGAGRG